MSRIFLDSSVIIYLIEGVSAFHVPVATAFQQASQQDARYVVSDLTRLECRVRPVRDNDSAKLARFDGFFCHLPTALEQHADVLWTGDQKLAQVAGGFVRVVLFPGGSVQP